MKDSKPQLLLWFIFAIILKEYSEISAKKGKELQNGINVVNDITFCFPGGSDGKESACNVGDQGLIPGSGRSPGDENDNPLWYSSLEMSLTGYSPPGCKESDRTEQLTLSLYSSACFGKRSFRDKLPGYSLSL